MKADLLVRRESASLKIQSLIMNEPMAESLPDPDAALTDAQVVAFDRLAMDGLQREYPNKPSDVLVGSESIKSPRELHPSFYGCFDWHSSVHRALDADCVYLSNADQRKRRL